MSVYGIRFIDESEKNFLSKGEVCSINGAVMEFHVLFFFIYYLTWSKDTKFCSLPLKKIIQNFARTDKKIDAKRCCENPTGSKNAQ